jgi:transglutaminase-like putative cysteine protease
VRYRIRHDTTYSYARKVDLSSHMLHLTPRPLPHQCVVSSTLVAMPTPTRANQAEDDFGNIVNWLSLEVPHQRFAVAVEAVVEVAFPAAPEPAATPPWERVATLAAQGGPSAWRAAEFAFESPMAPSDAAIASYARTSFPPCRPVLEGLLDLNRRIYREFQFRSGVTTIQTPPSKVLAQRAGVCQDFTHLMLAGLRALGLPARYTSGYLRTRPPPGMSVRQGADQSHAWVGAWMGPEHGWIDLDPTNDLVVHDEHVVLAWGRDYGDISPVRGIILGGGKHSVTVGVDLRPDLT